MTQTQSFEVHLSKTHAPNGELSFTDIAAIARSMQELATRVARYRVDQQGTGRTLGPAESAAELRLTAITDGSTGLVATLGAPDVLPIDDGLEQAVHDSFWEMVAALGSDQPPAWAPALVKESALAVLEAFDHAAGHVRVTSPDRAPIEIVPRRADRAVWSTRGVPADRTVELVGRLEAVDLRSTRFRLRDAAGNAIALHHVVDAERAAALVGQRALATGEAIVGDAGQVVGVEAPTLVAAPLPESWTTPVDADYEAIIGAAPGPDPDGGVEFTDEEFAEFLAATDH